MKTLVVLSALVSLAIAAPALPGEGGEGTDHTQDWHIQAQSKLPDVLKREKKSPSEINTGSILNTAASNLDLQNIHHIESGAPTPLGRSISLKKPLIVKKKYGYRLYRDSEEEKAHADSRESCGRQVKVKLCDEDGKFSHKIEKSLTHGLTNIHTSEDDVKHSIRMAKEAVENLQRDLKKIEMKTDMKTAHQSESDTELHEDIEVARQALEHIHENFGTLESMSLHATTTKDSEAMHDVHVTIAKTEEERMAQWKEAIENIQKNVEIARNIEDSFKVASSQDQLLHLDQSESATTLDHQNIVEKIDSPAPLIENMRAVHVAAPEIHHEEKGTVEDKMLSHATNEHLSEHNAREEQHIEDDMKTDASEMIETHIDNIKNHESLRSENHVLHESEKSAETKLEEVNAHITHKDLVATENIADHHHHHHHGKIFEHHTDMLTDQSQQELTQLPFMKAVEEEFETKLDNMKEDTSFKTSERNPETHEVANTDITSSNIMKPLTLDATSEHLQQRNEEVKMIEDNAEHHHNHHHVKQEKSADHMSPDDDDMIDFLAKSADHIEHDQMEQENVHKGSVTTKTTENVAEHVQHLNENGAMKPKEAHSPFHEIKHSESHDHIPKSAEHLEMNHLHKFVKNNEGRLSGGTSVSPGDVLLAKSTDHTSILDHQKQQMIEHEHLSHVATMKAAEAEHLHHLGQLAHENRQLAHLSSMKAAEEFENSHDMASGFGHGMTTGETMDHMRLSHLAENGHNPSKMAATHDFDLSTSVHPHLQNSGRYHNAMTHSNLHEMTGMGSELHPNFHPSMREAMDGLGSDHMFRWRPTHESARGAYGAGLSGPIGSPGAVGVFPNANVGGCAIPLLLSCSPSVVSGSLAKAHGPGVSSYGGGPAYRTEDEFGFHNKRDTKKTNDKRTITALRTPTIVKQKNPTLLENKV